MYDAENARLPPPQLWRQVVGQGTARTVYFGPIVWGFQSRRAIFRLTRLIHTHPPVMTAAGIMQIVWNYGRFQRFRKFQLKTGRFWDVFT